MSEGRATMTGSPGGEADEADRFEGTPHPRHATRLVGHDAVERDLLVAYRANRLPHAVILGGPAGVGKATLAWRLARFVLTYPDPAASAVRDASDLSAPPNGRVAAQVTALSHPDLILLRREPNEKTKRLYTEIRADDVRRTIALFQRAASAGGYRICILDSADDLNRSSANALLKLIEEPPPRSLFMIVAHRPGLVLPTIRSRARALRLASLAPEAIAEAVASIGPPWSNHSAAERAQAAAQAGGSLHGALRLLGSRSLDFEDLVRHLLARLPAVDWREVHRLADQVTGRDGEARFAILTDAVYAFLARAVRAGQGGPRTCASYADAWETIAAAVRETDALNLDKRPLILSMIADLAGAVGAAG